MKPIFDYGIPQRIFLLLLRSMLRFVRDFDGALSYICALPFKKKTIIGKCKKRGICCKNIGIHLTDGLWHYKVYRKFIRWWYEFVYNFEFLSEDKDIEFLFFRCRYLKNNLCSIHKRRPFICRNYPLQRYFKKTVILPGCGYSFVKKE